MKQNCTLPFWTHLSLLPLSDNHTEVTEQAASVSVPGNTSESLDKQPASPEHDFDGSNGSDDELSELIDVSFGTRQDGAMYCETMKTHVNTI